METTTNTIPACPNPNLYEFTWRVPDRRTKTGYRVVVNEEREFPDADTALMYAQKCEGADRRYIVEIQKVWVLKQNFMSSQPGFPQYYWERWDTPYCCSPSSELYWSM